MEERILKIEQQLFSLKRDVGQLREVAAELVIGQGQHDLALIQVRNTLDEHAEKLTQLARVTAEILAQFIPLREEIFQNTENVLFLVKSHGELTDKVNRMEEELGEVKRTVFEHTILLKNLRRDVEQIKVDVAGLKTDVTGLKSDVAELKTDVATLKTDVAELKSDVAQIKTDVADLKTGQTQILEAIRNLQR